MDYLNFNLKGLPIKINFKKIGKSTTQTLILQSKVLFKSENFYLLSTKDFKSEILEGWITGGWMESVHSVSYPCLAHLTEMCPA